MKAIIKPIDYCSQDVLKLEHENIFKKCWHFICLLRDLENENDFVSTKIGNIPVLVQRIKGEIRCFKNICSHRHSLLQLTPKGNRALFCPYHGWSYNEKGALQAVPKKPLFNFTEREMSCLALESFKIEVCGTLVFVNLDKGSQNLQDYLGNFYIELASMSSSFGELIDVNNMSINANWKILVENTLESYHVNLIHTDTFRKLGASGIQFNFNSFHSRWDAPLLYDENDGKQEKVHRPFQNRSYKVSGYKHLICFPNILISTTYGISFNLSIITPIDENSSSFTSYVFLTNGIDEEHNKALLHAYKESLINFNRQVFDEDKEICEHVQVGVTSSCFDGELSDEEMRVCEFQKSYAMLMGKNL